jgi:hypothetical protein
MTAVPEGAKAELAGSDSVPGYPFVNIVIPYEFDESVGLDGVELSLGELPQDVSVAVQIKDPLWYYRNLAHFVFSAKAGERKTIWFDTRDRLLPKDKCLYMTVAFSRADMGAEFMQQAGLRLVYKARRKQRPSMC